MRQSDLMTRAAALTAKRQRREARANRAAYHSTRLLCILLCLGTLVLLGCEVASGRLPPGRATNAATK